MRHARAPGPAAVRFAQGRPGSQKGDQEGVRHLCARAGDPMTELVVVSFRGPVAHDRDESGRTQTPAASGGLVTGLLALPDLDSRGTWVCAAMTEEDRAVAEEGLMSVDVRGRKLSVRMVALEPQA